MGAEATCKVTFKGQTASGKARLETDVLYFRGGEIRLSIPFKEMSKIDEVWFSYWSRLVTLLDGRPSAAGAA